MKYKKYFELYTSRINGRLNSQNKSKLGRSLLLITISLILIVPFGLAHLTDTDYDSHHMMNGYFLEGTSMYGFWILGWFFMILMIFSLILLIIWLSQQIKKSSN